MGCTYVHRFNRYIVECKQQIHRAKKGGEQDLIDTQWNVNPVTLTVIFITVLDLIDTQWNVNISKFVNTKVSREDLIDTQWNVNVMTLTDVKDADRI